MFKQLRLTFLIGLLATGSLFLAACSDDGGDADDSDTGTSGTSGTTATEATGGTDDGGDAAAISVALTEWAVTPSAASASAGEIAFDVSNDGTTPHNLVVIQGSADDLTVEAGQVVTEGHDVLVETDDFAAGEGGEESAELEAGDYVLFCNVAGHYDLGMHTSFTVN